MSKSLKLTITAIILAACSTATTAESLSNFNYDTVEVGVGVSDKLISIAGSKSVHPNAYISAELETDVDDNYAGKFGIGFNAPITDWADIHGGIHGIRIENNDKPDDSGWAFEFGYKQWVSPQTEVFATLIWDYLDESDIGGSLGGYFHATNAFSIGAKFDFNGLNGDILMFTTKYDF